MCRQTHPPRTTFSPARLLHSLVVRVYNHTLTSMAQVTRHIVCVSPKNIHTSSSSRNVVHIAEHDHARALLAHFFFESVFQHYEQPCGDQRPQQSGALTEIPPLTRCTNLERSQRRSSCEASVGDHFPATSDCVVNELCGEKLKKA